VTAERLRGVARQSRCYPLDPASRPANDQKFAVALELPPPTAVTRPMTAEIPPARMRNGGHRIWVAGHMAPMDQADHRPSNESDPDDTRDDEVSDTGDSDPTAAAGGEPTGERQAAENREEESPA
jgi:hypothetical protein